MATSLVRPGERESLRGKSSRLRRKRPSWLAATAPRFTASMVPGVYTGAMEPSVRRTAKSAASVTESAGTSSTPNSKLSIRAPR